MVLKKVPQRVPKKQGGGCQGHLNFFQTEGDFLMGWLPFTDSIYKLIGLFID